MSAKIPADGRPAVERVEEALGAAADWARRWSLNGDRGRRSVSHLVDALPDLFAAQILDALRELCGAGRAIAEAGHVTWYSAPAGSWLYLWMGPYEYRGRVAVVAHLAGERMAEER